MSNTLKTLPPRTKNCKKSKGRKSRERLRCAVKHSNTIRECLIKEGEGAMMHGMCWILCRFSHGGSGYQLDIGLKSAEIRAREVQHNKRIMQDSLDQQIAEK